ncbi:MAG: hypothetical protein RIS52_1135, partial [Pseudomonadota bacterium]
VNGLISVAVARDKKSGKALDVELRLQGIPLEGQDRTDFIEDAVISARDAANGKGDVEKLRESVRLAVRREATDWTGKKPIVDVMILNIG